MADQGVPLTRSWSWGAGTRGQLASGDFNDRLEPLPLTSFAEQRGDSTDNSSCARVLDMAGGGAHAVAVLGSEGHGQVVTWGSGQSGALGHGDETDISTPTPVAFFQCIQIRSVAAGWSHTAFVSDSGELYTCGNGAFGQLGHGDFTPCLVPCKVQTLPCKAISAVACGMRHTLVLTRGTSEEVEVYAFGSCKRGQLGIGDSDYLQTIQPNFKRMGRVPVPQRVVGLEGHPIVLLTANGDHSGVLLENGVLFLWGRGFSGGSDEFVPVRVGSRLRFSKVALGWNHGLALADGQLWSWGSNERGQLGIPESPVSECASSSLKTNKSVTAALPEEASTSEKHGAVLIRVGGLEGKGVRWLSAGAEHSAVVLDDGKIMAWGWGEHGQLGLGTTEDQSSPNRVSVAVEGAFSWRIFCGSGFTFAVAEHCEGR